MPPQPGQRGPEAPAASGGASRRSVGAANCATRTWRGSRPATSRLIAPPLPLASQPSKTHAAAAARSRSRSTWPPSARRSASSRFWRRVEAGLLLLRGELGATGRGRRGGPFCADSYQVAWVGLDTPLSTGRRKSAHGDPSGASWTPRSLRQRTSATCARSSRPASSAPRSSGTTSSSTARPPRWSSTSCSSRTRSRSIGTLAAFGTFAVGFVARPLGGVVFGHFGDRVGRKSMLVLSLVIMGVATFLDRLPADATRRSASLAPVLLVLLRFVQGIGVGGEWGGAVLMAVEHAPKGKRGFYGASPQIGVPAGLLLSTVVFLLVQRRHHRGAVPGLGLAHPVPGLDRARRRRPVHPPADHGVAGVQARSRRPSTAVRRSRSSTSSRPTSATC